MAATFALLGASPIGAAAAPVAVPSLSAVERESIVATLRDDGPPDLSAAGDDVLMNRLVGHARTVLGLRLAPSRVDPLWALAPAPRRVEEEISLARGQGALASWIGTLEPSQPEYQALAAARRRYQAMLDLGGWRPLPSSPVLRPGGAHPAVLALRERLRLEGFEAAAPNGAADRFGPELEAALQAFQALHGLDPDGVLGAETRRALDVPTAERLAQIDANLERWRWLPRDLPGERVELNVARQELVLYRGGLPVLAMKVIAGRVSSKTPMFSSRLEAVVLNPSWHVPGSIARNELWPQERRSPGTLARRGFVVEGGALRQVPGPNNALGRLKFEMPSPFGVYLHDTPAHELFGRRDRLLSHGCMRLERPRDLAALLLGEQGWTSAEIDAAIAAGATRRIALDRPVALFVVYRTAEAEADGSVRFGGDPYGWDRKLTAALAGLPR